MFRIPPGALALILLLVAEGSYLSIRFDSQYLSAHPAWSARVAGWAPEVVRLLVAIGATAVLLGRLRGLQRVAAFFAHARQPYRAALLSLHGAMLVPLVVLSQTVFDPQFAAQERADIWVLAWLGTGTLTVVFWTLAIAPWRRWMTALEQNRSLVATSAALGVGVWSAGMLTQHLWSSLARYTFNSVEWILMLMYPAVVTVPSKLIIGTTTFKVAISQQCSGLEGIGLILAFLTIYLSVFRRDLRFPAALALLPLGAAAVWSLNVVRIAALIVVGSSGWPDVALGGFHSQAGWLAFNSVGLGTAAMTLRSGWFSSAASRERIPSVIEGDLTAAYLMPFIALLGAGMITGAMSSGAIQWLYPLQFAGVAWVLWIFRKSYSALRWRLSLPATAIGIGVAVMWIAVSPADVNDKSAWPAALASVPVHWAAAWLLVRLAGFIILVPIVEELAFRGFLTRWIIDADFQRVPLGTFSWRSLVVSSVLFGAMHGRLWMVATIAGMLFAVALYRRSSLGDAVQAHATANAVIAFYVLTTGRWSVWS
jgi:exosortase E/protease (VPEID-CTERM system)